MAVIGHEQLAKWEKEAGKEQYKKISYGIKISKRRLFNDFQELDFPEKVIYIALSLFKDERGHCWPSMRLLADGLGCSKTTIQKYIWTLEKKRFLKIDTKRGKKGKRHEYWLLK